MRLKADLTLRFVAFIRDSSYVAQRVVGKMGSALKRSDLLYTTAGNAGLILSLEAVFAVLAGWRLLDETLPAVQFLACVLIFSSVLLSQFKDWNLRGTID